MKVSCLLLTFNEEANIGPCLEALSWCDDIVIVDSGSTDDTIAIARECGARVITRGFDNFAKQRNWGLDNGELRHEWVLHLDADEIATPQFVSALESLQPQDGIDAYNVPSKTILYGKWIRHAGMYPTYQVRLGHRDRLRFVQVGHGQREDLPASRVGVFHEPYLHYSFSHGMFGWLAKHVRYARDEAALITATRNAEGTPATGSGAAQGRRAAKERAARLPVVLRPLLRFVYIYLLKQGFRDGRAGFAYAFMLSVYEGMTAIFVIEERLGGNAIAKPAGRRGDAE
ncbi:MAG: glycosyltransferase family 2 protein [Alteraurantiacibacter sp.]